MRCAPSVAAVLALLLGIACRESEPVEVPSPPPEHETGFKDPMALLDSIKEGTFAQRVGLKQQLEALKPPDPVQIDFGDGTRVPQSQQPKIEKMVKELGANPDLRVDLIGCSDPSGSEALNRRVSQARAEAVADRLRAWKVPSRQLGKVVGRGESCEQQERMVEIRPFLAESSADGV